MSSTKALLKKVKMLERVLNVEPEKNLRMGLDWKLLTEKQRQTMRKSFRLCQKALVSESKRGPLKGRRYDWARLTQQERVIVDQAIEIWQLHKEPERDIQARYPIH